MAEVIVTELDRLDEAFAGNRLLATFAREARAVFEPFASIVDLNAGDSVFRHGQHVQSSLFPFGPTMVSMVVELAESRSVEVASIGREGAIGGIVSCGHAPAFSDGRVQVAGPALKMPMTALEDAKTRSAFIANLFCRYADFLLAQVMQSVACNAFHAIPQRAARWLLTAQDRSGSRIEVTQEALAGLLGVQRTSINAVVGALQEEGLIEVRRGAIEIRDRAGLKRRACECYDAVEGHFVQVIGPGGSGGSPDCSS
jgi:hypothetical protein